MSILAAEVETAKMGTADMTDVFNSNSSEIAEMTKELQAYRDSCAIMDKQIAASNLMSEEQR